MLFLKKRWSRSCLSRIEVGSRKETLSSLDPRLKKGNTDKGLKMERLRTEKSVVNYANSGMGIVSLDYV